MGSRLTYQDGLTLEVIMPQRPQVPFDIVGVPKRRASDDLERDLTEFALTEPGVYRVMVRVIPTLPLPDGKKWILGF